MCVYISICIRIYKYIHTYCYTDIYTHTYTKVVYHVISQFVYSCIVRMPCETASGLSDTARFPHAYISPVQNPLQGLLQPTTCGRAIWFLKTWLSYDPQTPNPKQKALTQHEPESLHRT